jgi:sulfur carrier protein
MHIFVNQVQKEINQSMDIASLLEVLQPKKPFAISLNSQFIAKTHYAITIVQDNDRLEIISPVTGG